MQLVLRSLAAVRRFAADSLSGKTEFSHRLLDLGSRVVPNVPRFRGREGATRLVPVTRPRVRLAIPYTPEG